MIIPLGICQQNDVGRRKDKCFESRRKALQPNQAYVSLHLLLMEIISTLMLLLRVAPDY